MQLWNNKRSNGLQLLIKFLANLIVCWLKHHATEVAEQFTYVVLASDLCSYYTVQRIAKMTICCLISKHNLASYIVIYQLIERKVLDKKILENHLQFARFANFFSLQNFVLYSTMQKFPQCSEICSYFVKLVTK